MGGSTSTSTAPCMDSTSQPLYTNTSITGKLANPTSTGKPGRNTVREGDSGVKIADKLGCTFDELNDANRGGKWDHLLIGQELNVCA
jgi:hypothetical protein